MRLHIKTTPSKEAISFNYQHILTGAVHKWLGKNNFHDAVSLYSFSWLNGAKSTINGLSFPNGASFFISFHSVDFGKRLISGIQNDNSITDFLQVREIQIQDDPNFHSEFEFYSASPIFIKRKVENRIHHYTFLDEIAGDLLTETLKTKLRIANISDENVTIKFNTNYAKSTIKVIHYNGIGNKVSICPIIISGTQEQLTFAWNVGIGNSTGIGFGALK